MDFRTFFGLAACLVGTAMLWAQPSQAQAERGPLIQLSPEETGDAPGTLYEALPPDSEGRIIYVPRGVAVPPEAARRVQVAPAPARKARARATPSVKSTSARNERRAQRANDKRAERAARSAARRAARAAAKAESSKGEAQVQPLGIEPESTATVDPPLRRVPASAPAVERAPVIVEPPPRRMIAPEPLKE